MWLVLMLGYRNLLIARAWGEPRSLIIKVARAPFRVFAVQRLFHSVEMSILIFIFSGNENLIRIGLPLAAFVTAGHLIAILSSRKLEK